MKKYRPQQLTLLTNVTRTFDNGPVLSVRMFSSSARTSTNKHKNPQQKRDQTHKVQKPSNKKEQHTQKQKLRKGHTQNKQGRKASVQKLVL